MSTEEITGLKLPQPEEISEGERDDAMGAYLMMFASLAIGLPLPFLNIIASLIYFFVNKKRSPFVAFHALQALLAHIPVVLLNAGAVAWVIVYAAVHTSLLASFYWYLIFTGLINLAYIVWSIVALIHANRGRFFYMPVFGRISFAAYYGPGAVRRAQEKRIWENKPPEGF